MPITNFHVYFIDIDNFLRKFVDSNESANKSVIDVNKLSMQIKYLIIGIEKFVDANNVF